MLFIMKYSTGTKIAFTAVNENSQRIDCIAEVISNTDSLLTVKVLSPIHMFKHPPEIELIPDLIEHHQEELRYTGEIAGAVLIPSFLWQ
jgi:hypothetical protein